MHLLVSKGKFVTMPFSENGGLLKLQVCVKPTHPTPYPKTIQGRLLCQQLSVFVSKRQG